MSVLIKGMEMPTRCAVCVLCDLRYGTKCKITKMSYYDSEGYPRGGYNGRPDWCPLVEVPTPHSRLIDVDKLLKDAPKYLDYPPHYEPKLLSILDVENAPTVIEAEKGENHDD